MPLLLGPRPLYPKHVIARLPVWTDSNVVSPSPPFHPFPGRPPRCPLQGTSLHRRPRTSRASISSWLPCAFFASRQQGFSPARHLWKQQATPDAGVHPSPSSVACVLPRAALVWFGQRASPYFLPHLFFFRALEFFLRGHRARLLFLPLPSRCDIASAPALRKRLTDRIFVSGLWLYFCTQVAVARRILHWSPVQEVLCLSCV